MSKNKTHWFLDRAIARITEHDSDAADAFFPKQIDGDVNEGKRNFTRNLFSCLYCGMPKSYWQFGDPKPEWGSADVMNVSEEVFFKDLVDMTYFRELRFRTVRNMPIAVEVLKEIADDAWSSFYQNAESRNTEYLLDDDELSPEDTMRAQVRQIAKKAAEVAEEAAEAFDLLEPTYGIFPSSNETMLPSKDTQALLALIRKSPHLQGIIEMLGRVNESHRRAETNRIVRRGAVVPHLFDLGNDLARVLPAELVIARRFRQLFLASIAEGNLLQEGLGKPEDSAEGDIIVLCDESASMKWNNRNQWAKAIAAAAFSSCREQSRQLVYWDWGYGLGKEKRSLHDILVSFASYGGTDIPRMIQQFTEKLTNPPKEWDLRSSDILLITDEESPRFDKRNDGQKIVKEWQLQRKRYGIRVLAIAIGAKGKGKSELEKIADRVIRTGDDPSKDLIQTQEIFEWIV